MSIYGHVKIISFTVPMTKYGHLKSSHFADLNYILIVILLYHLHFYVEHVYNRKITVSLTYFIAQATTKFQKNFSVHITITGNFKILKSTVIVFSKIVFILISTISGKSKLQRDRTYQR